MNDVLADRPRQRIARVRRSLESLRSEESGSAIVEFVFVAVLSLIPLIYLVVAVAVVNQSRGAVGQGARDAGRAFATASSTESGRLRARVAVRLDLANAGLPDDATLLFVAPGAPCAGVGVAPELKAGARYDVCVTRRTEVPAVPSILLGRGIMVVARFSLYIDDFRSS